MSSDTTQRQPWQGLNHLALITNDMDATVRFWHGVIGAPLGIPLASLGFLLLVRALF